MDWEIIWNISDKGYQVWVFLLIPLAFVIVGIVLAAHAKRFFLGSILTISGIVVFVLTSRQTVSRYFEIQQALQSGNYDITEGVVMNLVPAEDRYDPTIKALPKETFSVGEKTFSYHHRIQCWCYNQTAIKGGLIHEGLYVRISSLDGDIIRIEEKK